MNKFSLELILFFFFFFFSFQMPSAQVIHSDTSVSAKLTCSSNLYTFINATSHNVTLKFEYEGNYWREVVTEATLPPGYQYSFSNNINATIKVAIKSSGKWETGYYYLTMGTGLYGDPPGVYKIVPERN